MNYFTLAFKKYADFRTRSRRSEYWYFALFSTIVVLLLSFVDGILGFTSADGSTGVLSGLYSLFALIPSIALSVRRLHDVGKSGWWLLIAIIPIIGAIVLLVWALTDSGPGANKYGPNPKESGPSGSMPSGNTFSTQPAASAPAMPLESSSSSSTNLS